MTLLVGLRAINVLPLRLTLRTAGAPVTVPMLRGVWGAALHEIDLGLYRRVFAPEEGGADDSPPLYVLRPARPDGESDFAVDFILLGEAVGQEAVLLKAWAAACEKGLGPTRTPFQIVHTAVLGPDGQTRDAGEPGGAWSLAAAAAVFSSAGLQNVPCQLRFSTPVRLIRSDKLVARPTLVDVVVAGHRRLAGLLPPEHRPAWAELRKPLVEIARQTPQGPWEGESLAVDRYSGRQRRSVVLEGVLGGLELPEGAGDLSPLLAALAWAHVGKGTVMGLGGMALVRPAARQVPTLCEAPAPCAQRNEVPPAVFYSIGVSAAITPAEPLPPLPPIPRGALVVIEGRAPIWAYAAALHRLHASPAGAVAVYDPRLGAVVVASHSPSLVENQVLDLHPPESR